MCEVETEEKRVFISQINEFEEQYRGLHVNDTVNIRTYGSGNDCLIQAEVSKCSDKVSRSRVKKQKISETPDSLTEESSIQQCSKESSDFEESDEIKVNNINNQESSGMKRDFLKEAETPVIVIIKN